MLNPLPRVAFLCGLALAPAVCAEDAFERAPIAYSTTVPQDAITTLKGRLTSGQLRLEGDERDVVRKLLTALNVPEESQMLVFSKTSFQKDRISPARPRAIYFSDEVYVGWCPGGLVELATIDPVLGPVFYSFDPHGDRSQFQRDPDCLRCHGGTFVRDIPGLLVRSMFADASGQPLLAFGSELVDFSTPIEQRWGGWYVTAARSGPRHRGNLILTAEREPTAQEMSVTANLRNLDRLVDTRPYLTSSSDVAALLVFEHQVTVQNALTKANQECLRMISYQKALQKDLKETVSEEPTYDSVRHVFAAASEQVLDALLSRNEASMPNGGIQGVGGFASAFVKGGPSTHSLSGLRQLDLQDRLFKYRCSYLIGSTAFDRLQPTLRRRVLQRLGRVLTEPSGDARYAYLEPAERSEIRAALVAAIPNLPRTWRVEVGK
jgi:hypothetical protein